MPTITNAHALDVVLCWGWIDGIRKAFDERSTLLTYLKMDPRFDSLRADPRFKAMLRRLNFLEEPVT